MEMKKLGRTGLCVSRLGFGGIPIQKTDPARVRELMQRLCDRGINYIDTARGYTVSEEFLGKALLGIRDRFVLATKSMARTAEEMARDIDISLKNLRTDYIDIYQVHNPTVAQLKAVTQEDGALEALLSAKAAGKIGHIGVTAHSTEVFSLALSYDWVETVMFPYNIVETQGADLIRECRERDVGFICMKPLAGGALEDAALAMRFIAANDDVTVVIPGMESVEQIEENLAAVEDNAPLSAEELSKIDGIRATLGTRFCRRCNYCAPCSAGINISGVFLMEGYLSRYGLEDWARARYGAFEKKASDCIDCGVCESRCPYELPIRDMLREAAAKFGS